MDTQSHSPFLKFIENHWFIICEIIIIIALILVYVISDALHKPPNYFSKGKAHTNITNNYITNLVISSDKTSPCTNSLPIPMTLNTSAGNTPINNINQQNNTPISTQNLVQLCATVPDVIYDTDYILVDLKANPFTNSKATLKPSSQRCEDGYNIVTSTINQDDLQGIIPYDNVQPVCTALNGLCAKYMQYQDVVKNKVTPLNFSNINVVVNETTCNINIRGTGCIGYDKTSLLPICLNI